MRVKHVCFATALALALVAPPAFAASLPTGDVRLGTVARDFFRGAWRFSPGSATSAGVHDFDGELNRVTPEAFAAEIARLHSALAQIAAIPPSALSLDGQIDRQLLENDVESNLFALEAVPAWRNSPDYYVRLGSQAIFGIMARSYAPAEKRLIFLVARERQIPAMLAQAQRNLDPSKIPAISADTGIRDADGAAEFIAHDVPQAFAAVNDSKLQSALASSTAAASAAYRRYAGFIRTTIAPKAHAPYAIGPTAYAYLERLQNVEDIPLPKLLAVGEANLAKDKAEFVEVARRIDPKSTPARVADELKAAHPAADQLLPSAQNDLYDLVTFIKAKGILDLPDAPIAKVVPTPKFERQFTFASMDPPGPLETKATEAYYNVTPVEPTWSRAQAEEHLGFFNKYQILIVSAHETYPGHYVNYLFNKRAHLSLIRKLEWNPAFGEGWAHYDEQMVVDEGLGNGDPRYRLAQLSGALTRDCRYLVGIKEHTQGMTIDEATQFFMENAFMGREPAYREAVRGTQDPLYGYYTLGKLMILKLRDDYRAKVGSRGSLRDFHDALLSHGDPPIYYLRKLLLGPNDDGSLL